MQNFAKSLAKLKWVGLWAIATLLHMQVAQATTFAFSPNRGATQLIITAITQAKQSLCVAAYTFTSAPIANSLIQAEQAGIDVRIVLDGKQSRQRDSQLGWLKAHRVPVRLNSHYAIMHNKFIVVDGTAIQLGSFNYTRSAEIRNAENTVLITGQPELAKAYQDECDRLWNEAKDIKS